MHFLQPLTDLEELVLEGLHSIGLGWGLAIVALTVTVRLLTLPLTLRQLRASREMARHAPELRAMRERHRDDPQALREAMLAYQAEHGFSPLAPFLPLLVQIPIFLSLYSLLRHDVSDGLFGSDGFLFIPHLTESAHGAVLGALLLTYLVSQVAGVLVASRAVPAGQRGVMLGLPALFTLFLARFPAGLLVYSITTSLWTLGQRVALARVARAQ